MFKRIHWSVCAIWTVVLVAIPLFLLGLGVLVFNRLMEGPRPAPVRSVRVTTERQALQELVAVVVFRTDSVRAESDYGTTNLYATYVDAGVREKLVAYRVAREGLTSQQGTNLLLRLEQRLRERNEFPILVFVQPAEGTTLELREVFALPIEADHDFANPVRFDSLFRKEISRDTLGFYYYRMNVVDGAIPRKGHYIDPERDATLLVEFRGRFTTGGDWFLESRGFKESAYIDLLPTDPSLALLPEVVLEYVAGSRPVGPNPSLGEPDEMDIDIQWDLSARDILTMIGYLLTIVELLGVGM